jgi:hypothetical protein
MGECRTYMLASTKKLGSLRKRLATETNTVITAALTHLWEKETERSAIAIQKEIDKRDKGDAGPK